MQRYGNARHVFAWCSLWSDITSGFPFRLPPLAAGKVVKLSRIHLTFRDLFFPLHSENQHCVFTTTLDIYFTLKLIKTFSVQVWNETKFAVRVQFSLGLRTIFINVISVIMPVLHKYVNLLQIEVCQNPYHALQERQCAY